MIWWKLAQIEYRPITDEWGDMDENLMNQAYALGKAEITVLSDKEPAVLAVLGDKVVGILFTSLVGDSFSFDIVVDPSFRRQGIATELAKQGLQEFQQLSWDMPIELQVDVVNPHMRSILEGMGLVVLEEIAGDRVIMGRVPENTG